jgi:hypothetical protein
MEEIPLLKLLKMKICSCCKNEKELKCFRSNKARPDGLGVYCRDCERVKQKIYRKDRTGEYSKKYEKTKVGFLMRLYRNMLSRISGVQKEKYDLYKGKTILDKPTFYEWANNNPQFHILFDNYELSGYDRKLAPSVDRIDSNIGYSIDNIEFITHSENSRRGTLSKCKKYGFNIKK